MTVKPEFTGKRDLTYNFWHRTLGKPYWMVDLDCVEVREERGCVAIIERALLTGHLTIEQLLEYKNFEIKVVCELAEARGVPAFLVFYTADLQSFHVYKLENKKATMQEIMNSQQYSEFLRSL